MIGSSSIDSIQTELQSRTISEDSIPRKTNTHPNHDGFISLEK